MVIHRRKIRMNKKDLLEIKNRLKKTGCTFTRLCGCYVNVEKEMQLKFNENFMNLEEEEFFKYLEIAKKTLSGNLGNNLIELEFPMEEEFEQGKQRFLMGIRESKLKNEGLMDTFYQLVIDHYEFSGNYLILVFHDAYDVLKKTTDQLRLDESEEVYEYLLVAICPMTLTKPGLGYLKDENRIGPRNRDWVVGPPDAGFLFPAFTERSADIHATMFYTKDTLEPHGELMELVLGCKSKPTGSQQKEFFGHLVKNAIGDSEKSEQIYLEIQEGLSQLIVPEEEQEDSVKDREPVILTKEQVKEILGETDLTEDITVKIETGYEELFHEVPPVVDFLLDKKILTENEKRKVEKALADQVVKLQEKLEETIHEKDYLKEEYDVVLQVKPEKLEQIKTEMMDGKRCIVIPLDENELANLNGNEML